MANLVYTYALIKALYDEGGDYLDSFVALVLDGLKGNDFVDVTYLQSVVKAKYTVDVPIHVTESVLNRARKRLLVERSENLYRLTAKGNKYVDKLESPKEVDRRINTLVNDIQKFYKEKRINLSLEQIHSTLLTFLRKNIEPFVEFINPEIVSELDVKTVKAYEKLLIEYICLAEKQKTEIFNTVQDLVLGSIISVVLYSEDMSDISDITSRKFSNCTVFLDSNFLFSVLGLRANEELNEAARELIQLLRNCNFNIKVFDFTVNEISHVLGNYLSEGDRFPISVNVDDICSSLRRKGYKKSDIMELIANLETKLGENGIDIHVNPTINIKTYSPSDQVLRSRIQEHKPNQTTITQNHDLASIEIIQRLRRHSVRQIERAKAIFLTSDNKLSKFNFEWMGHKENNTVAEVILDRLMTNILWLKNPKSTLPMKSIIAAHSRELFINRRVWNRFYEILVRLKKQGKIDDENISMLFYQGYIQDTLNQFDEGQAEQITEELALSEIEKSAKVKEKEVKESLKEKEKEFLLLLEESVDKTEKRKDVEWLSKLDVIRSNIKENTVKSVKKRTLGIRLLGAVLLCIPLVILLVTQNWQAFQNYTGIIAVLSFVVALVYSIVKVWWLKLETHWINKMFLRRMKEAGIQEVQR